MSEFLWCRVSRRRTGGSILTAEELVAGLTSDDVVERAKAEGYVLGIAALGEENGLVCSDPKTTSVEVIAVVQTYAIEKHGNELGRISATDVIRSALFEKWACEELFPEPWEQ